MALYFTVVGKTKDPELLAEERYYRICEQIGLDCQIAAKKYFEWKNYYTNQEYLLRVPEEFLAQFKLHLKEAA